MEPICDNNAMKAETLRERNKSDKLQRIRVAARHLFSTQGFDATSTREIATLADVGLATLFLYAFDKRDLLFLAGNDDLEALAERASKGVGNQDNFIDQLTAFFSPYFLFCGQNRLLARDLLRELPFFSAGPQSNRFQDTRQKTIGRIETLVAQSRTRGMIGCDSSDIEIAQVIFDLFEAEVRRWLGQECGSPPEGVAQFERLLRVVISGLNVPAMSPVASLGSGPPMRSGTRSTRAKVRQTGSVPAIDAVSDADASNADPVSVSAIRRVVRTKSGLPS